MTLLEAVGQRLEPDRADLASRVVELDPWWRRCGCEGTPRDTIVRRLAHETAAGSDYVKLTHVRKDSGATASVGCL